MRLGINIDHIATLRQARKEGHPNVLAAAQLAMKCGADSITVHLREDRRHIQDSDVSELKYANIKTNLEMAATDEMVTFAKEICPHAVCFVPEKRSELTTEGGLDILKNHRNLAKYTQELKDVGVKTISVFIEADAIQIDAAKSIGATAIEFHTGKYALATKSEQDKQIDELARACKYAKDLGIAVHAGHGLNTENLPRILEIKEIEEVNIGFSIVARAVFVGLVNAIEEVLTIIK